MKIVGSNIFCCMVMIWLSAPAFSEESQNVATETVNCEQQAMDQGVKGEELDGFIADCESKNSEQGEAANVSSEEMPVTKE